VTTQRSRMRYQPPRKSARGSGTPRGARVIRTRQSKSTVSKTGKSAGKICFGGKKKKNSRVVTQPDHSPRETGGNNQINREPRWKTRKGKKRGGGGSCSRIMSTKEKKSIRRKLESGKGLRRYAPHQLKLEKPGHEERGPA